jgi:multidrug transporter EmrE-like cation transporter
MNPQAVNSRLKFISYLTLFASIAFGITGQLLMKQTMTSNNISLLNWSFLQQLVLALTVYSLGIVNWIYALRVVKLSIAYPLTSLNYVGILFGSYYLFDEIITPIRIAGVILIFVGVLFVAIPIKSSSFETKNTASR